MDAKPTARPEDAVAPIVNGAIANALLESAPNAMVWAPGVTVKLWRTGVAAAKLLLPGCEAWIVQVPAMNNFTIPAATVQTANVVDVKVTARTEDAVALTANGAVPSAWFESAPNVTVWPVPVTVKCWLTGGAAA
jgi:hypothetical protein